MTYFFRQKFDLQEGKLGSLFFTSSIIAAISTLVASSISKRIGNVKVGSRSSIPVPDALQALPDRTSQTMVFTHLPSAICLALIPVSPTLGPSILFLLLRACTQSMDVAPRSAFLAAIILPGERTAVMGTINVVKTFSQSMGPSVTGLLATRGAFWAAFVLAGCLKASYDLGMLAVFRGRESREEQGKEDVRRPADRDGDDEEAGEELGELLADDDDDEDDEDEDVERMGRSGK